jgi:hypothetical protein
LLKAYAAHVTVEQQATIDRLQRKLSKSSEFPLEQYQKIDKLNQEIADLRSLAYHSHERTWKDVAGDRGRSIVEQERELSALRTELVAKDKEIFRLTKEHEDENDALLESIGVVDDNRYEATSARVWINKRAETTESALKECQQERDASKTFREFYEKTANQQRERAEAAEAALAKALEPPTLTEISQVGSIYEHAGGTCSDQIESALRGFLQTRRALSPSETRAALGSLPPAPGENK